MQYESDRSLLPLDENRPPSGNQAGLDRRSPRQSTLPDGKHTQRAAENISCRRTQPGIKRVTTQDEPIEALSSTARGPVPPQGRGRTSMPKRLPRKPVPATTSHGPTERTRRNITPDNAVALERYGHRQNKPAKALPLTTRAVRAPGEQPHRTGAPKILPRQRVRRAGESPSDRTSPPTPSTTNAPNRNHARSKFSKIPVTSFPRFRECAGKAIRFAGPRCDAQLQGARWRRRTPPPRSYDERCGPAPWRACRPDRALR